VIVERSLAENPNSADLLAVRAVALMQQSPPRVTDAKQDWSRAVALGLRRRDAFLEWAALEDRRGDLRSAVASLGVGLERNPRDPRLLHQSGYANSRLGQSLLRGIDTLSGYALLDEADRQLRDALRLFRGSSATDYVLGRVYRALVVNAQHMEPSQRDRSVVYWTLQWLDECPTSPDARAEAERQSKRHQEVKRALDALARPQGS
jgi:tetratricopeptide (TPR) repeat protein